MSNPSARLLALLTVLQSRRHWTGAELVERLGVSPRTIRYDVEKLRALGYQVHGTTGVGGGYELRPGSMLPPLLLGDDEAVAIALGLRLATGHASQLGEQAATALVKLEQVLPARLRGRVNALRTYTAAVPPSDSSVDPDLVLFLTTAARDHQRVRFDYSARDGSVTRRDVEPHRLLQLGRHWYLVAFDPQRNAWRHFRLDRVEIRRPAGARFAPRPAPDPQALLDSIDAHYQRHRAVVLVFAPADVVSARLPAVVPVEPVDEDRCRVHASGESAHHLAVNLLLLDRDFLIETASPDVRRALQLLGKRVADATSGFIVAPEPDPPQPI
ncbi:helix-turn-helix transcriptional regulator [Intrasporangium sp.]|uniref:helix-turn-helix transcriptional regulator n=1 Tax=Intrasporangium sp. TaxID=1925024 RepID=UPI00293ADF80|nr:WYL domain-containing protein [Intrasporangium sp.]MDV3222717.1 WYL domain-containing protein [Intrasporangium sp.]